jgi:DNA-binding Xre family transcriptional regulator
MGIFAEKTKKNKPFPEKFPKKALNVLKSSHLRDVIFLYMSLITHGGVNMAVTYKKLFHMLIEKDMTTTQLQQKAGFSANIVPRMKRNGYISLDTIESICRALECGVDDILEFLPEEKEND